MLLGVSATKVGAVEELTLDPFTCIVPDRLIRTVDASGGAVGLRVTGPRHDERTRMRNPLAHLVRDSSTRNSEAREPWIEPVHELC